MHNDMQRGTNRVNIILGMRVLYVFFTSKPDLNGR